MQLPDYRPFPWLSDVLSLSAVLLAVVTYSVLFVQLFFVPLLLNRVSRAIILAASIGVGLFFAVVLAMPWSSLTLIALTAVFVSERTLVSIDIAVRDTSANVTYWFVDRCHDVVDRVVYPAVDWTRDQIARGSGRR